MRCLIEGCNHSASRRSRMQYQDTPWKRWQICPCCAIELELWPWVQHMRCRNAIEMELGDPPVIFTTKNEAPKKKPRIGYYSRAFDRNSFY